MIRLANKEGYRLDIKVGVSGDSESKSKITAVERMTQQVEKKTKALGRITANATAKLKDEASSKIDKIDSKLSKLKNTNITVNAKVNDQASSSVDRIENKTKKVKAANVVIKAKDEASAVINKIDKKISGWIKAGAKKVIAIGTAGVIAAGGFGIGESIKTFSEYEKGLSNVKAVTNATDSQMKQLDATAKLLGSTTAWSARHVTEAEELLGQAGFSVDETISALPGLLDLASAGDLDLAAATDIASGTLKAFSLNARDTSHVADVLALSASATNSDVTDLGEAMKYCAPVSQSLGISLEDTAAAVGLLSNANIKGSQSGTVLRQTMARLSSPTDEAIKMMSKYGINAFDAQENMKPLSEVVDNLNSSLGKLTSKQRADVISTIFGTESMSGVLALMNQGGKSVGDLSKQLKDANGEAKQMAETKLDNLNGQWIRLKAAVGHMQITLGEKLAPYAKQFVDWLTGKMPEITEKVVSFVDYVSNHTGQIKAMAVAIAGIGIAFSGLKTVSTIGNGIAGLKALGGLLGLGASAGAVGSVGVAGTAAATGLGELAIGANSAGIAASILPAIFSPVGLAIAAIGVTAGLTAYALSQDVVPSVDLFADGVQLSTKKVNNSLGSATDTIQTTTIKISDATKKSVGAYMDMDNKVQKSLLNMKFTNAAVTDDISNNLASTFKSMGETITTELDKDLTDSSDKIQKMLSNTKDLTGTEQTDILAQLQNHYANQKTATQNAMDEINGILSSASQSHRQLTSDEYSRIDELRSQMTTTAVTSLSENEQESAVILGRIKDQSTRLTAETASEIVKQLEDQRVKTIDSANVEYAERVKIAEAIRSEGGAKAEETANKIIEEAQKQRDETINAANETKAQGIDTLKQSYTELGTAVDDQSGKILNWWDRLKAWWGSNSFESKTATIDVSQNISASGNGAGIDPRVSSYTPSGQVEQYNYPDYTKNMSTGGGYASGTDNASPGMHPVAENGYEIITQKQNRLFTGGEKVLNHDKSKTLLETKVNNEPFQVNQGQYNLVKPQVQMAGVGGISIGDIQVNVSGNKDTDSIVEEVVQVVGYKLKEAITNIKSS